MKDVKDLIVELEAVCKGSDEIEKFNPYHDNRGRFSTANSAASFTYKPGQGVMYDRAIEREKKRTAALDAAKPKEDPQKNPETIGGAKRGAPMTREQANEGHVNPNYNKGGGYWINCQSCVVAYEARLRGYDVQTKPNTPGSKLKELSHKSHEAWLDPETGKPVNRQDITAPNTVTTAKKCKAWLEESVQEGARYTFAHVWKGGKSGHIISADRDSSGKLRLYDPQSGKTYQDADIDAYLKNIKHTMTLKFYNGSEKMALTRLMRIDNMQFNPYYVNDIMEATTNG